MLRAEFLYLCIYAHVFYTHVLYPVYVCCCIYTLVDSCTYHAQDKKIAHCDLGVWKGESVDSWDPMHAERERMLTLKALLADKEVGAFVRTPG